MKTDFQLSNLLGTVYCRGNLLFTPDGTCLLSPVGNRVTVFDLVHNKSYTLPFAHRTNIARIALTPRGNLLLTVDETGRAILSNFQRRLALHHLSFKGPVTALTFSPSGEHFAVSYGRTIEVWQTPSTPDTQADGELSFAPFVKHHSHVGHTDNITSLTWSNDSRFFLSTSKDLTARVWSLTQEEGFEPTILSGHREGVLNAWFSSDQESIYTISQDGALFRWGYVPLESEDGSEVVEDSERWRVLKRNFFMRSGTKVTSSAFHTPSNLIVVGFSDGLFGLYDLPDFNQIHQLSISQTGIDFVTINQSGEWLAFGASKLGQLLVWEWQSESYILKQQGHFDVTNAVAYSPDGQQVVTAADDGKIKLWDLQSGFCMVTFTEHSAAVTACQFAKRGRVLYTASLDGSIRAWDLVRYRNFRTFTASTRLPFSCLAVDTSGEVVCAGSLDSFDVHIWSVQTGQLLDQLAGHEGPVTALAFSPSGGTLVSGSWDRTIRTWDVFGRSQNSEPFQLQADVLDVAVSPDSKQIAVSTLDGQLTFWSIGEATQESNLDGRQDVSGGRLLTDRRTAANAAGSKSFNSITYSVDGSCLLAGGNSKYLCLYDVQSGTMLKKFTVSVNLTLDGTQEYLNSRNLTEAGPLGLIDDQGDASDLEDRIDKTLPGVTRGDASVRKTRPEVRVASVSFSPTARSFCAASSEGLLIYSLDNTVQFDPFDLDTDITPATIVQTLDSGEHLRALVMAFRLNEMPLIRRVYENVPAADVQLLVRDVPTVYLGRLLRFVAAAADTSPHLEFNLLWLKALFSEHGIYLKDHSGTFATELRTCQKAISRIQADLARLADGNTYMLDFLLEQPLDSDHIQGLKTNGINGSGGEAKIVGTDEFTQIEEGDADMNWEEWQGVDD